MALTDKLTAIADTIREKTNTSEKITLAKMPEMIASITGGGVEEFVNFYDYDGKLLRQYPIADFAGLPALPPLPDNLPGCHCVGWNYDLETIRSMEGQVNVAAIYVQDDEEEVVHEKGEPAYVDGTKLYLHIDREMTVPFTYRQSVAGGVRVLWGDGSSDQNVSTKGSNITLSHKYAAGDYVIQFEIEEGCILSLGSNGTGSCVIGTCSINSTYVPVLQTLVKAEIDLRDTVLLSAAFRYCLFLKEVVFGDGAAFKLPTYLFENCMALEKVKLCESITYLADYDFRMCYRLRNIELPASITGMGSYVFQECRRLREITIPNTVKTMGSYNFQSCYNLKNVILENGIPSIGAYTFSGCQHLEDVHLPNSIKTINSQAFYQCYSLTRLIIPKQITSLSGSVFQNCVGLKYLVLPEGITEISGSAFRACYSLPFVGFPKSLTKLGDNAFYECWSLLNAVFGMNMKTIGNAVFQNCYSLAYLVLPQSMESVGTAVFSNCKSLKVLSIPKALQTMTGIWAGCDLQSESMRQMLESALEASTAIRSNAFESTAYLEKVKVPEGITEIGSYAFRYNYHLDQLELPSGLLKIGSYAFEYVYHLAGVSFPVTLASIEQNAFSQCFGMEKVQIPGNVRNLGANAFLSCYNMKSIEIRANNMTIGNAAFGTCYGLRDVILPVSLTAMTLNASTFSSSGIEKIPDFPKQTKIMDGSCFNNCMALEEADISGIEMSAASSTNSMFASCYALGKAVLPESVSRLGSSMFQNCYALADEVEIPAKVTELSSNVFYDCRNLKGVRFLGNKTTLINSNAFYNCYALQEIRIPYRVATMQQCFNNCFGLARIYMYPLTAPTGISNPGTLASDYIIYVPKGSLSSYETQWPSCKGHFQEFGYLAIDQKLVKHVICLKETSVTAKNIFFHSKFDEGQEFQISCEYGGRNLKTIKNLTFLPDASVVTFDFERSENMDYDALETVKVTINTDGIEAADSFEVQLKYVDTEQYSYFEVDPVSGYAFALLSDGYYESTNQAVNSSYSLCKVRFATTTEKIYIDCIGEGEANYDYGILSNLDMTLTSSNNPDSGTTVKKSFYGRGKYTETVEYDVSDYEEHFIYIKYRKDGSVNTGADSIRFRVRFE